MNSLRRRRLLEVTLRYVCALRTTFSSLQAQVDSKYAAELRIGEYNESLRWGAFSVFTHTQKKGEPKWEHPISKITPTSTETRHRGVCVSQKCCFMVDFQRTRGETTWDLKHFKQHDAYCGLQQGPDDDGDGGDIIKRRQRCTAYEARLLSGLVVECARKGRFRVQPREVRSLLRPYTRLDASEDLAWRVLQEAYSVLYGAPKDNLKRLKPYLDKLKDAGFGTNLVLYDADRMDSVTLARAKSNHKRQMGLLPREKRTPFDGSNLPKATRGKMYLAGWHVMFPSTKRMLDSGEVLGVYVGDFAFCRGVAEGNYGSLVGFDANNHIVPYSVMWTIEEETTDTWTQLVSPAKVYYRPHLDSAQATYVADADKGGLGVLKNHFRAASFFICDEHRGVTAAKKFPGAGRKRTLIFLLKSKRQQLSFVLGSKKAIKLRPTAQDGNCVLR